MSKGGGSEISGVFGFNCSIVEGGLHTGGIGSDVGVSGAGGEKTGNGGCSGGGVLGSIWAAGDT